MKPGRTLTIVRADVFVSSAGEKWQLIATMLGTMMRLPRRRA